MVSGSKEKGAGPDKERVPRFRCRGHMRPPLNLREQRGGDRSGVEKDKVWFLASKTELKMLSLIFKE